jgi:hypothetical protein
MTPAHHQLPSVFSAALGKDVLPYLRYEGFLLSDDDAEKMISADSHSIRHVDAILLPSISAVRIAARCSTLNFLMPLL